MAHLNNYITAFIKVSIITTLLFGGLLAQSYATNLITDSIMKMNVEFSAYDSTNTTTQTASIEVLNEKESSFNFGDYQLDVKTDLFHKDALSFEEKNFLAQIKIKQLGEFGQFELVGTPEIITLRNQWAEITLDTDAEQENIKLKLQFEEENSFNGSEITSG